MRVAIMGNAGAGKSTIARRLAGSFGTPVLDLDTVAWEPGKVAVPRDAQAARDAVQVFCSSQEHWIIEGCYGNLIDVALAYRPYLIFLDPGLEQCTANCRARPWEPHKYPSRQEQDRKLEFLLAWVTEYYRRSDDMSHAAHKALFDAYDGKKALLSKLASISEPPSSAQQTRPAFAGAGCLP